MEKPIIFDYFDFREFLKEMYTYRKKSDRKFTHRYIIDYVGASSSGWFSDIINDRITLTQMYRFKLSELFELTVIEDDYFSNLVNYAQSASFEEKKLFYERIIRSKTPESNMVLQHQFDFYRIWYISAIRELLLDYSFDGNNYQEIANLLTPQITADEAEYAVKVLLENKLIEKTPRGYEPTSNSIKKEVSFSNFYWKCFMQSAIGLSQQAIEYPKETRDISAVTFNISQTNFVEAQSLIADLRKKLLHLENSNDDTQKVYQCNIQLFPLSREF